MSPDRVTPARDKPNRQEAEPDSPGRRGPGRPRDASVDRTILATAAGLLARGGFHALNYDKLASTARCSKATIYRRWPSKVHLALAALAEQPDPPAPDTGVLRDDLRAWMGATAKIFGETLAVPVMLSLLGESARDHTLAEPLRDAFRARRGALETVIHRAVERGELPADSDVEALMDLLVGPVVVRFFLTGTPVSSALLDRLIDTVLAGFRATSGPEP